jgi:hypothetical protein
MNSLTPESVDFACDRIGAFSIINESRPLNDKVESISVLLEGLGITDDVKERINERLNDLITDGARVPAQGAVMFGILVGLWMSEYANDA